ncbi:MAG: glycoside hydrolase family 32 protein [Planctomycetota bacterium]|nr:glycoside hydrolase family 32 protein [Planctomycetota bacterium]
MKSHLLFTTLIFSLSTTTAVEAERDDILVADFEGDDYGAWKTTGEAFGPGPARGTLPGQMHVTGYRGKGLANSFFAGDRTTGTLTSPPLKVERRYLVFLIGGGGYPGTTCINLLHEGKSVRSATGPNTEPGGSEELVPYAWDVKDLSGKRVTIQIVDKRTGGWGHVNVDHIVQSDKKPEIPQRPGAQTRELTLVKKYLLIPIRNGAKKTRVDLHVDGENVREFAAELAGTKEEASFWSFLDISAFRGKRATLHLSSATEEAAALIVQSDDLPVTDELYSESLRPQFHFSQVLGWNNDPNGMVYYDGEWHLYFQHNPYGWKWGNMHWGHAVSKDLVHWEQLPIAIYNKRRGDWAFSGGAVVDENNTAGWQTGKEKVIVASWTSTGRGECVAYSNDRGRTFTEYEGNPVIKHGGRDPKIIWYEPGKHWVLAVYDDSKKDGRAIAFYSSGNMKEWKLESKLRGYYECPEFFELPVDGDKSNTRWVVFAADAHYAVGKFDGKTFTPEHAGKRRVHYGPYYASQLFNNTPDGRRIQIGWTRIAMPGMPFNQTFSFPHRLTLRTTDDGIRLFAEPVKEIEKLRRKSHAIADRNLAAGKPVDLAVSGELFDIRATFEVGSAAALGLDIGGNRITYDVKAKKLNGADLELVDGRVSIRVLVDRPMLEIIGNGGRVFITSNREEKGEVSAVTTFANDGEARLVSLEAHELESIWKKRRSP